MKSESEDINLIRSMLGSQIESSISAEPIEQVIESVGSFEFEEFLDALKIQFPTADLEFFSDQKRSVLLRHRLVPDAVNSDLRFFFEADELSDSLHLSKKVYKLENSVERFDDVAFIDCETIGLSGGSGTLAFLVGVGWWDSVAVEFVLEQVLIRDFDGEPELIDWLDERIKKLTHLCTYNGKSFDVPLLRSRSVMCGVRTPVWDYPHLDLLHFSRRLWKGVLERVSLTSVEEGILGLKRTLDLPSAEIPEVWHTFSRGESFKKMTEVLAHHAQDILSLAGILQKHLSLVSEPEKAEEIKTLEGLEKWFRQQKEKEKAEALKELIAAKRIENDPARSLFDQAQMAKESSNYDLAFQLFQQCLEENSLPWNLEAALEIADYHARKDDRKLARRTLEESLRQHDIEADLRALLGEDLPEDPHQDLIQKIRDRLLHLQSDGSQSNLFNA